MNRALAAVSERALRQGPRAGLEALLEEVLRLSDATEAALYRGRQRVAATSERTLTLPATLRRMPAAQVFQARDGRASLVVRREWPAPARSPVLERMADFAGALLAAESRECAAQARQARLLRENQCLTRTLAHQEGRRRKAAHDLRTPLLVIQGYVGMMLKGAAGPLTPTMERYLRQLLKASGDQSALIDGRLSGVDAPEDLRALLTSAFSQPGRARRLPVHFECAAPVVPVAGPKPVLELLVRTLARGLAATGAKAVDVTVEAPEGKGAWTLRLRARTAHPLPARTLALLEQLVQRLGGHLTLQSHPALALTLHLPAPQ